MKNNYSLEELPNGIKVYQSNNLYKFTKDAIDLAKFCVIKSTDNVLELCAGSGVIGFYAYSLKNFKKLYFCEIQKDLCEIIRDNIELNHLESIAECKNDDIKNLSANDFDRKLDVIICNPPYFKTCGEKINEDYSKAIARHEICITLEEIIKKASQLIKDKGKFYLVMLAERSAEVLGELYKHNFACKRIKYLTNNNVVYSALFEAVYNGKVGVKIEIEK